MHGANDLVYVIIQKQGVHAPWTCAHMSTGVVQKLLMASVLASNANSHG